MAAGCVESRPRSSQWAHHAERIMWGLEEGRGNKEGWEATTIWRRQEKRANDVGPWKKYCQCISTPLDTIGSCSWFTCLSGNAIPSPRCSEFQGVTSPIQSPCFTDIDSQLQVTGGRASHSQYLAWTGSSVIWACSLIFWRATIPHHASKHVWRLQCEHQFLEEVGREY